ncbi:hypothetical protein Amsp01_065400 [Amycolatopsis sp. NBRC 101858]|nr:hypothetical protein Amsp01_065400 [Amycolatopsis sp. NBRC 101858]
MLGGMAAGVPASAGQPAKDPIAAPAAATEWLANNVTRTPTWIWQCPATNCNRGENVVPGDVLLDFCYVSSGPVEGNQYWDLVYVRTESKRYAGFIPEAYLADRSQDLHC